MRTIRLLSAIVAGLLLAVTPIAAGPDDDTGSVYNYAINWAVQTGTSEITVEAQARYCSVCNPNPSGAPGCTAFGACFDGYGHQDCYFGRPSGTYIAARVKDVGTNTVLGTQKLVLKSGVNFTLNTVCKWQFIFGGLSLSAGDQVKVEADTYCSWCGHWYPNPVTIGIVGSNTQLTYTGGDTSALVGTSANVCATLIDTGTGNPLPGKTITFTLNPSSPIATVAAVTNASGVACAVMPIPVGTPAGIYTMDSRFAGDASYFPSSDQTPFEVRDNEPPECDANGPYEAECEGEVTQIALDGTGSSDPDGDPLTYSWETDCPGGAFDNQGSPTPILSVTTDAPCPLDCTVTLTVDDGQESDTCSTTVTIEDTKSADISCPSDVTINWDESTDPSNTGTATATDDCDPNPVVDYADAETQPACPADPVMKTITRTWTASDSCGNPASSCVQTITVLKRVLDLDIKPGSCPNPLNVKSPGKLPIALAGTVDLDVATMLDYDSLSLRRADCAGGSVAPLDGPPGPHTTVDDVATPFPGETCDCHELTGDGIDDLAMKFSTPELVAALGLGTLAPGEMVEVVLTGQTTDGTPFRASDCIRIVPRADFDMDNDVDLVDFGLFQRCFGGPGQAVWTGCEIVDIDEDGDVDISDFGRLQRCMSGPGQPVDPDCDD